ncbi:hypothetical protein [Clostridium cylindrosporum]|uniref:Ada DNA repair metal-binding domain-containing protein n=1 Tax=Clostridium cylindrosporum DSM 605 TaxID=1121307 RepID=A0A0J8D8R8_CLOCY|nr:hypothetical protein [Clostridium cylindrosporum]KMT22450.1 hypothetical protein CLCY_12c00330 [Clostridium cylindrosporum DSM 605]
MNRLKSIIASLLLSFIILTGSSFGTSLAETNKVAYAASKTKKTAIVYITNTGHKYHRDSCRYLSHSKISIDKSKAIKSGYTACKVCRP